jgi:putative transposase
MVTSNHIHLLLLDVGSRQTIPGALQLIAGRTGQEYNRRKRWIDDALKKDFHQRESRWTESVAVGSKAFIEQTRDQLGFRAKGRSVEGLDEVCALREANKDYDFAGKNSTLRSENTYSWNDTL